LDSNTPTNKKEAYLPSVSNANFRLKVGSIVEIRMSKGLSYGKVERIILNKKVFKIRKYPEPLCVQISWIYSRNELRQAGYRGSDLDSLERAYTDHRQRIDISTVNGVVESWTPDTTVSLAQ
jgi:hypothetical protein